MRLKSDLIKSLKQTKIRFLLNTLETTPTFENPSKTEPFAAWHFQVREHNTQFFTNCKYIENILYKNHSFLSIEGTKLKELIEWMKNSAMNFKHSHAMFEVKKQSGTVGVMNRFCSWKKGLIDKKLQSRVGVLLWRQWDSVIKWRNCNTHPFHWIYWTSPFPTSHTQNEMKWMILHFHSWAFIHFLPNIYPDIAKGILTEWAKMPMLSAMSITLVKAY